MEIAAMFTPLLVSLLATAEPAATRAPSAAASCCAVHELRQYTLKPGQRDVLIALFEREFVETQEAVGMHLVGQFRDLDRPDRFVWIRGFPDMRARAESLQAFYGGPVWQTLREAANATTREAGGVDGPTGARGVGDGANASSAPAGRSSSTLSESIIVAFAASRCVCQTGPP
jgi:hypothetical protein